jgi:carboxyl-terminal processing protease
MRPLLIALTCVLLFAAPASAQIDRDKAILLKRTIELNHYSPRPVDDSFSLIVFRNMIDKADPRRLLFTAADYKALSALSLTLDDELNGKGWAFLDLFTKLYGASLSRADSIVNKLLQKPFDFAINESISSTRAKNNFNFATDRAALESRWGRYLKFIVLSRVHAVVEGDSTKRIDFKIALSTKEPAIREKIKQNELRYLKKVSSYADGFEQYALNMYLNAVASGYDPHTNYFPPQLKEIFKTVLSGEGFSFGIDLDENDKGEIVIEKLTPGGPAWKSGELHKGDVLVSLQWEGKEEVITEGLSLEEVEEIINEYVHQRLVWKFRKADGTDKTVLMIKETIEDEENIVKSFVLKGEKKIGYILLPGFYTEWEGGTGSSCANDVAKEIVKLKRENIEGLILDVRFNGGGSMGEAIDMIGIFIDEGPLGSNKEKDGKQVTIKDPNRGTIYDGPLVLMVNGQSASASEMLAAALQDYHRAVIAGSNTFGKATMQQMFALDTFTKKPTNQLPGVSKDIVKVTMGKLYRLTGQSAQLNGVKPDIVLPDAFDGLEFREKFREAALTSDTAKANSYYKPLKLLPLPELATKSEARLAANQDFNSLKKVIELQKKEMQATTRTIPLKWDAFQKWAAEEDHELDLIRGESNTKSQFAVENHAQDKLVMQKNQYAKEINQTWLENLAEDIYIQECYLIVTDLINLTKR